MSDLIIRGGNKLSGEITPAGNKNSALPIICASLLTNDDVIIRNVPDLTDVNKLLDLMGALGSDIEYDKKNSILKINNSKFRSDFGDEKFPLGMRGAVLLLAPLISKIKKLKINSLDRRASCRERV